MRAVLQRVASASVTVDGAIVGAIGPGLLILLGVGPADAETQVAWLSEKISQLRVFPDDTGRMNRSLVELGGAALVVSQFTLYADVRKGRRPSFVGAAPPEIAEPLYARFCAALGARGVQRVERGVFGADMQVALVNDGPVTLVLDTP
jgi:D-tyrosyl-tRNA(Tyr) deacylase